MGQCNILFPHDDIQDEHGCLKPNGHNDHHICRAKDGRLMAWEDDYNCNCGCWDDIETDSDVCLLMWEVKSITD